MAINTLITIKDALTEFTNGHAQLKYIGFEADDHREPIITQFDEFPILFVAPIDVFVARAMNIHTLRIYVYERINDDRLDVWENANDTSLILRDIRVWWNDYGSGDINIVDDPIGTFASDRELDNLVGYYADFRFEIPSHGRCDVPVNIPPTPPTPSPCVDSEITVNGNEFGTVGSGETLDIPILNTEDTAVGDIDGSTVVVADSIININTEQVTELPAETELNITVELNGTPSGIWNATNQVWEVTSAPCADAEISLNGEAFPDIPSGGIANIEVRQSSGSVLVGSKQGQYFRISDSEAVLKNTSGTVISTTQIKAEESEDIIAPDTAIEVNGVSEGSVVAGATLDIQLSNIDGVVTPLSVTQTGNDLSVVLPYSFLAETVTGMFEQRVIFDNGTFEAETCLINILKDELI